MIPFSMNLFLRSLVARKSSGLVEQFLVLSRNILGKTTKKNPAIAAQHLSTLCAGAENDVAEAEGRIRADFALDRKKRVSVLSRPTAFGTRFRCRSSDPLDPQRVANELRPIYSQKSYFVATWATESAQRLRAISLCSSALDIPFSGQELHTCRG